MVGNLWMLKDTNTIRCIVVKEKHTANKNEFEFMSTQDKERLCGFVAPGDKIVQEV